MTDAEWITFMDDFSARFPSDFDWLNTKAKTRRVWFRDIFSGLGLEDCLAVSLEIFRTGQGWKAYERDRIPSHYQSEVGKMRQTRRDRARVEGYSQHDRKVRGGGMVEILAAGDAGFDDGISMLACFKHCEQMKRDGQTPEQRQAYVDEYFGG